MSNFDVEFSLSEIQGGFIYEGSGILTISQDGEYHTLIDTTIGASAIAGETLDGDYTLSITPAGTIGYGKNGIDWSPAELPSRIQTAVTITSPPIVGSLLINTCPNAAGSISIFNDDNTYWYSGSTERCGRYVGAIPIGDYSVRVSSSGWITKTVPVTVVEGEEQSLVVKLDVVLPAGYTSKTFSTNYTDNADMHPYGNPTIPQTYYIFDLGPTGPTEHTPIAFAVNFTLGELGWSGGTVMRCKMSMTPSMNDAKTLSPEFYLDSDCFLGFGERFSLGPGTTNVGRYFLLGAGLPISIEEGTFFYSTLG
jgi:hypothetical protein